MIQLVPPAVAVHVTDERYARLLGYPRGHELTGRSLELSEWARDWYQAHGRPWNFTRETDAVSVSGTSVEIEGERFRCGVLRRRLRHAQAESVVLGAFSAGRELEAEANRSWREDKPDEYYFLEVFGSAVVEQLAWDAGSQLRESAAPRGLAVLPHYSPGYPGWDIAEQARLLGLLARTGSLPGELEALESGALRPKKSLLAVFGLTQHTERARRLANLPRCASCGLAACQFRASGGEA
jgi:hypothetical protein